MAGSRSLKEYVERRFETPLFDAIAAFIDEAAQNDFDSLGLNLRRLHQIGECELSEIYVKTISVYDLPGMQIGFDVGVEAYIEVREGNHHYDDSEDARQWFLLKCTGDLDKALDDFAIHSVEIYDRRTKRDKPMYDSLVPVMYAHDYETRAREFFEANYPKALLNNTSVDPMAITDAMKLNVQIRPICEDCSVFGQVYFRDTDTELYNDKTCQMEPAHIKARTILVDPRTYFLYNLGMVNSTIIHECVHWHFHRKAFELERLWNDSVSMIGCKVIGGVEGINSKYVNIMEQQANALTAHIQMPYAPFKRMAQKRIEEIRKATGLHDYIDIMEMVIDQLAADFVVSRLAAKIRMVEVDYHEAIGTFNYVDGHYVKPFTFRKGSIKKNQTFTISAEDLALQLVSNQKLKQLVADGVYLYVDSHLVLAASKYLSTDADGFTTLTDYARRHMDECCLAFDMTVSSCNDEEYFSVCYLNKDKDAKIMVTVAYSEGLQYSTPERQREVLDAAVADMYRVYKTFTTDYVDCLQKAFKWRGMPYTELAQDIGMNPDAVSRIINGKHPPTIESLALICLGLKLPSKMSSHIIQYSPCNLAYANPAHIWIDVALQTMPGQAMSSIKKFLNDHEVYII